VSTAGAPNRQSRELARLVGHTFADPALLTTALTHPSVGERAARQSYERLEFLGDRVLGLSIAELLLERFPQENEGDLSKRLVSLVRAETLATVADGLDLDAHLEVGASALGETGRARISMLSDACEALIGALFLDGGLEPARAFVRRHWADLVEAGATELPLDPKTALQEWLQGRGLSLPTYTVLGREGPAHAPEFTIEVAAADGRSAHAVGASKRAAEQAAAEVLLNRLEAPDE
jgi:ribonuclease III